MRRILIGGLGIALGVMTGPASAQDAPARRVTLGRPQPSPEPARPASGVTPVSGVVPQPGIIPVGPPAAMSAGAFPVPMTMQPKAGGAPSVTEVRDPGTRIPMGGVPLGVPMGTPIPLGTPMMTAPPGGIPVGPPVAYGAPGTPFAPPGGVVVPSVGPDMCPPGLEEPMFGTPVPTTTGGPARFGFPVLSRLAGGQNSWWTSGEYLMWWTRSTQLPPLVTTSSPQFNGILGQGDAREVVGGSFGDTLHSGARFGLGHWFDCDQSRGIEGRFFFLAPNSTTFATDTNSYPVLARPFFNLNQPVGSFSEVTATPGLATGGVEVHLKNSLWGGEVNFRRNLGGSECARLDAIVGYRYVNFKEELTVGEVFTRTGGSDLSVGVPAISGAITDSFRTENNFHGGQIGLTGEVRRGRWYLDGRASVAFGTVFQRATVAGSQELLFANGTTGRYAGGLLAVPGGNIGTFSRERFAVVPEAGLNLGYNLTSKLRMFVGYNFLYMSNVLRPAGVIDTGIDAARIPNFPLPGNPAVLGGQPRPLPAMRTTDFFAQGISFGVQFTW